MALSLRSPQIRLIFNGTISRACYFGTSSTLNSNQPQPPIRVYGLNGRYAHALYAAAVKQNKLDNVDSEVKSFQSLLDKEEKLATFLENPTTKKQVKSGKLMKHLKFSDVTANFFVLVSKNGRLQKVPGILKAFDTIMSAHKGNVTCTVTTAKALDEKSRKEVEAALQGFLKPNQKLILHTKVNDALIGGMIVELEDKYIDMSIAKKIDTYQKVIENTLSV